MNPPGTPVGTLGASGSVAGGSVDREPLSMDTNDLLGFVMSLFPSKPFQQMIKHKERYNGALTLPLLPVLHREFEYAIPVEKTGEALSRLKSVIEECDISTTLPIEVRFVAKDNSLLSPAQGRDVCYIGVATQPNANEIFARVEPIMKDFGGRPHWGKHFSLTRSEVEAMYPDSYEKFRQIRKNLDPDGVFGNTLLRDLLNY
jgi:FAD/FMN-containing dehydrogenase